MSVTDTASQIDKLLGHLDNTPRCPECGNEEFAVGRLQIAWHHIVTHDGNGTAIIGDENDWGDLSADLPDPYRVPHKTIGWCIGMNYNGDEGERHDAVVWPLEYERDWKWQ